MRGFAIIIRNINISSLLLFMQKSFYIEAILVVAIVSAVGYGTVVIRAMTDPNRMGDNQMGVNKNDENRTGWNQQNGQNVPLDNEPGVLGGKASPEGSGDRAPDDGTASPTSVGSVGGGVQEGGASDRAGESPDQPQGDAESSPQKEPASPWKDSNADVQPGADEQVGGDGNRAFVPTDSAGGQGQGDHASFDGAEGSPERGWGAPANMDAPTTMGGGIDSDPAVDGTSENSVSPHDQWFQEALDRLHGSPEAFPGEDTSGFPGNGATQGEFPGETGAGPSETGGDAPVEFGGTQNGDASGETGDDIIREPGDTFGGTTEEDEGGEEYEGAGEYDVSEGESAPSDDGEERGLLGGFWDFLTGGEKTPGNTG